MKKCSKCAIKKQLFEFSKKGKNKKGDAIYHSACKECIKSYHKCYYPNNKEYFFKKSKQYNLDRRIANVLFIKEYTKDGCIKCGEKDFTCLQFDHREPSTKEFNIS